MDYKKASIVLKQIKNQFIEMFINNVGKGQFSDDTYEEVQSLKQEEDEDFGFQQEDQVPLRQETQLYKKSIGLGPEKKPVINHQKPNLHVVGYNFVYGVNKGNKTIEIIGSSICRAVGVNIFCENQIYSAHNQKIVYLFYDSQRKILISGSQGKCAQIMLWRCSFLTEKPQISPLFSDRQKKILNLPLSSLGIGFAWFCGDGMLAVITKFNLHQNSTLYIFDVQLEKRVRCDIKLEKVVDICTDFYSSPMLLSETGIWRLQISKQKQCKLVRILEQTMIIVIKVIKIMDQLFILGGKMDGSLKIISLQNKIKVKEFRNHQSLISCIRVFDQSKFLTLGKDSTLNIYQLNKQEKNALHLQKIQLKEIYVNAFVFQSKIMCVSKSGQLIQFSKQNSPKYEKVEKNIEQKMLYCSSSNFFPRQCWIYDKFAKRYIYSISDSNKLITFSINENQQLQNLKEYSLSYEPFNIDIVGNIAAYTHRETKLKQKLKTQTNSSKLNNQITTQFFVLQDYIAHKILTEIKIDVSWCNKLKFSPEGDKLAMGFQDGKILIYDCNKASTIIKLKESKHHSKAIENVIWSRDSKFLKTISKNNLLYFDLQKKGQQIAPVFSAKSIKDIEWSQCGKFDWTNYNIWQDHLHEVDQVKDIKNSLQYQLVLMQNGLLKVFCNPAGKKGQQLIRLFQNSYDLQVLKQEDGIVSVVVMGEGIVFSLDIGQILEEDEQEIDEQN